ncbi:MAG TPA: bifunctional alpha,alpha-trehalose-phosphate synthase (UDP-forming)/trehalose-phosphatase [Gemmatimonadales bacterium]|nr:bifunctional alpha,alpha-trehalose-phosphate synthase (UDP-forming)/trehalose-phosphatase [Gemmatimonadales bacterium]
MPRVLIVANRLPVTVRPTDGGVEVQKSSGGLATGLLRPHEQSGGLWIGWSGANHDELSPEQRTGLDEQLSALRLVSVPLTAEQVARYYEGFSNGVLWPLFHYLLDQVPLHVRDWEPYVQVNEQFAELVASQYQPGDLIWVHDYQLLLLPQLLRRRLPDARIGFFLHIPFPAEELFRTLPERDEVLEGLLGADLVGFHTPAYLRHFAASLTLLGLTVDIDRVQLSNREVRLGVFPMGIDAESFAATAQASATEEEVRAIKGDGNQRLLVGVDRLDYTKGIPRRLLAYERMLELHPELRERVRLIQVAVPSRTNVEAYQEFRSLVDGLVGRINGVFGTPHWVPVHYIYRGISEPELVALYCAADVMVVTPLRDGMNLVAKEFVASRTDEDGVLVLSEFAGASWELPEAIQVNPYDVDATADGCYRALQMTEEERRARLRPLRARVQAYDVHRWAATFLEQLEMVTKRGAPSRRGPAGGDAAREELSMRLRKCPDLLVLLDYDGTLVPYTATPELARPDPSLLELLGALAARPETEVHVVSGRARETLEQWLGALPIALHAEHGFWSRPVGEVTWTPASDTSAGWRERALAILRDVTSRTPGSLVEVKSVALAWHYRMADREVGDRRANELRLHLTQLLSNQPVEILAGHKVVEIRPYGIHKGRIVPPLPPERLAAMTVLAMGDDRTDEDLFTTLPPDAITIRVGPGSTQARFRIDGVPGARALLQSLLPAEVAR